MSISQNDRKNILANNLLVDENKTSLAPEKHFEVKNGKYLQETSAQRQNHDAYNQER